MAQQVKSITSEALEAAFRNLTPSQDGFTEDLMASNVVVPVLDLTQDAGGGAVPEYQAQAIAFGSQTAFNVTNTTSTLISSPGFYRVFGVATSGNNASIDLSSRFSLTDGLSTKIIWNIDSQAYSTAYLSLEFDFTVFLAAGESLTGTTNSVANVLAGSTRQLADINGDIVYPSGFTPQ